MLGWNHPSVKETSKSKKLKREKGREREIAVRRRERSPSVTAGRCRCCSRSLSSPLCRSSSPSLQRENGRETAAVRRRRRLPLSYPYPAQGYQGPPVTAPPQHGAAPHRRQYGFFDGWRILIIIHGLNEHSRRYSQFAKQLNSCNFGVYAMDWIGHGGSDGLHRYFPSLDHVVADDTIENMNYKGFLLKPKDEWITKSTTNVYCNLNAFPDIVKSESHGPTHTTIQSWVQSPFTVTVPNPGHSTSSSVVSSPDVPPFIDSFASNRAAVPTSLAADTLPADTSAGPAEMAPVPAPLNPVHTLAADTLHADTRAAPTTTPAGVHLPPDSTSPTAVVLPFDSATSTANALAPVSAPPALPSPSSSSLHHMADDDVEDGGLRVDG
ncbi:hypothetical protein LWI29_038252 [Acer saccharum]|uniref:Serine aminopeptidase S33 domain-containing protein n=1 Tax=Acer saccharum TaxID=4024 RepID=A0AA39TMM1_ACESA|nr:hypothetical protein LWI29_038252 [Acer saccharum]